MKSLRDRFDKATSRDQLIDALKRQLLIAGDAELGHAFAEVGEIVESGIGDVIIEQGTWDDDVFFILAGAFEVIINGQVKAVRKAGVHVGELTGLKIERARTATLKAIEMSVTLRVQKRFIDQIASTNVSFWKRMADVVADRLDERNESIGRANEFPRVFVISSAESIEVARQIRSNLDSNKLHVHLWNKGTFNISEYPISDIEDAIEAADFTVSIAEPDDGLVMRGQTMKSARDNVHLEFGMSLGKLGRTRSILLVQASKELHLPSDVAGLTTVRFRAGSRDEIDRSVAVACDEIREHIQFHNVRQDRTSRLA